MITSSPGSAWPSARCTAPACRPCPPSPAPRYRFSPFSRRNLAQIRLLQLGMPSTAVYLVLPSSNRTLGAASLMSAACRNPARPRPGQSRRAPRPSAGPPWSSPQWWRGFHAGKGVGQEGHRGLHRRTGSGQLHRLPGLRGPPRRSSGQARRHAHAARAADALHRWPFRRREGQHDRRERRDGGRNT